MSKKMLYEIFIGLLALMLSIMLILELTISLPHDVELTFYYINIIVNFIFIFDYVIRLLFSKKKKVFIKDNVIDLLSLITVKGFIRIFLILNIQIHFNLIVIWSKIIRLILLSFKFKKKIKESRQINKFNYMLVLTTIVIVIGAVIISQVEGLSLGDALWWSFVTFTTVGYGDVLLTTPLARLVGVLLMIFGIGFIGITTSTIAAYIINGGKRRRSIGFKQETIEHIKYKLDNFDELSSEEIDEIYRILKSLK